MAAPLTDPLFVEDFDELLVALRLDGLNDDTGAESECAIIENALRKVRLGLFDKLGANLITELEAIAFEPNPTTADELRRMKAYLTEILWVKLILVRDLPIYFLDSSGRVRENWNEEGLLRSMSQEDQSELELKLQNELDRCLQELNGESTVSATRATTVGPDEKAAVGRRLYENCIPYGFS